MFCELAFVHFVISNFSHETQRHGLVFIYDMSESKYSNFDYDLSIKILNMLKVSWKFLGIDSQAWWHYIFFIVLLIDICVRNNMSNFF